MPLSHPPITFRKIYNQTQIKHYLSDESFSSCTEPGAVSTEPNDAAKGRARMRAAPFFANAASTRATHPARGNRWHCRYLYRDSRDNLLIVHRLPRVSRSLSHPLDCARARATHRSVMRNPLFPSSPTSPFRSAAPAPRCPLRLPMGASSPLGDAALFYSPV